MFEIKYNFSKNNNVSAVDADETALRYHLFLGSLILKRENKSIVIDWDWIPLIDFAICLLAIYNSLHKKTQGEEEFEFTESDARITFQKNENNIKIITSFSDEALEMNMEEFQKAINKFYKDIIFEVAKENQEIKGNNSFNEYLKEAEKM
ncbi:hypothetical protein SAMN05421747_13216 [Parapedobacter composti]|uniref:Uncharacterized protein n=1 Tax=Parapedobacter composti TaxID=623281 RepID=A0A1I1MCI3_9SPHI|nr:hypothetical protein [Parapedobacter composti]SFC82836.1 hypothetical protein SAMN05421747_13216 [Parapedobacter composti]